MKTYSAKTADVKKKWLLIDAENLVLGRLSSEVAKILRGKHKTTFTPHIDCGDNVVIINAEKVALTGNSKMSSRLYWRHTGHPGGIKSITPEKIIEGRFPERVIKLAVERMLPKDSPLARKQFKNMHVYKGAEHPHKAQNPEFYDFAKKNVKNKRAS